MISYEPFWETLKRKNISQYSLVNKQGFTASTLQRIREGTNISLVSINVLCFILSCNISDIICYKEEAAADTTTAATKTTYDFSAHKEKILIAEKRNYRNKSGNKISDTG